MSPTQTALRAEPSLLRRAWIDETIELDASRDDVFALMSELDRWSGWVPDLRAIWRNQRVPPRVGSRFFMVVAFPVVARVVLPCRIYSWGLDALEWGGGVPRAGVRHRFAFTALGPARTRVHHTEYATGLPAILGRPFEGLAYRFDRGWSDALRTRLR
ncbi:MAG TPA: hypothetical protein VI299_06750 [Polyangiales bacterium]